MSGLRVLAVTLRYPPYVAGGYELLTRDAVEALRGRGHRVTVLAGRGARLTGAPDVRPELLPDLDAGPDLFRLSHAGTNRDRWRLHFLRQENLRATRRALRASDAQVMLFFNLGLVSLAPILAARRARVPTLGYVSDPWPLNHWLLSWRVRGAHHKPLRLAVLRWAWRRLRAHVGFGRLLTCSEHLRRRLLADGFAPDDVDVLHLGVPPDMAALAATREDPRRAADEPLRVVCLSSFWEGKGQDVLLQAVARARADGLALELVLAGNGAGSFRAALEARAARQDLGGVVRFAPPLERAGVSDLLARSHVFVLPSTWEEPFALASLEAMAHGLAVVTTDSGGSPETVEHGTSGWVVPAGDAGALSAALVTLGRDEELRRRLGRAARARATDALGHAAFVDRLESELLRLVGGGGAS